MLIIVHQKQSVRGSVTSLGWNRTVFFGLFLGSFDSSHSVSRGGYLRPALPGTVL